MTQPLLHDLAGELKAGVGLAIDAPTGEEMAERVKRGVFRRAIGEHDAGGHLNRLPAALDDVTEFFHAAGGVRKNELERTTGARKAPLAQSVENERRNRNAALAGLRLRPADLVEAIGALPNMQNLLVDIDVSPSKAAELGGP
jgi:hypothetical protein